jgi:hypothetical protein
MNREMTSSVQLFRDCKVKKIFPIENIEKFFIQHYYETSSHFHTTTQQIVNYATYGIQIINANNKKFTSHAENYTFPSCWNVIGNKQINNMKSFNNKIRTMTMRYNGTSYDNFDHIAP